MISNIIILWNSKILQSLTQRFPSSNYESLKKVVHFLFPTEWYKKYSNHIPELILTISPTLDKFIHHANTVLCPSLKQHPHTPYFIAREINHNHPGEHLISTITCVDQYACKYIDHVNQMSYLILMMKTVWGEVVI